jgi:Cu2+-exporting ATPase
MSAAFEIGAPEPVLHPPPEPLCAHCALPVPLARLVPAQPEQFCCDGCRAVFAILHDAGLQGYYTQRDPSDRGKLLPRPSERKFEELDEPEFLKGHCQSRPGGSLRCEFFVEGVHCSACVWLLERLPRVVPAVLQARYDSTRSMLSVTWDPAAAKLSEIGRALASLGYIPHPTHSTTLAAEQRRGDRALLLRLGIAGAAAGNVMLMALALYSGKYAGMAAEYAALFRWGSLLIATPAVFWAGSLFFRGGLAALRTRTPHMDLPVSLGLLAGYLGSAVNTLRGHGEIYFDSLCTLVFLLLVGRYLQRTHQRRSAKASDLINALAPTTARVVVGELLREVPANAVAVGSIVEVRAGERVAVDGVVSDGSSAIDGSLLTGESLPVEVTVGDRVHAGTSNVAAPLRVRVESVGGETRLGRLMQSVEATQRERAPIVRLADRVAGYFVLTIIGIAVLTLLLWWHLDQSHALDHTVALLVVTCPCALGMATPLSVSAALRAAAQRGVLFKGGEFIEELARPGLIVFDKTGTLTEGRLALVSWSGPEAVKAYARAAEASSGHPIARAFQRSIGESALTCASPREYPGGIRAQVAGRDVLVGSQSFVRAMLGSLPTWSVTRAHAHADTGQTPVLIALDGEVCAIAAFADTVRADAAASLAQLAELGFQLEVLSGDDQRVVDSVVRELGAPLCNAKGGASPEAKLSLISDLRASGQRVFMVGDGVNDAAAMAAANVGIAVHGGAEACLSAADVFTTRPGLEAVALAALGSKRTMRVIRLGIALSLAYNVIGVALAVTGKLDPLLAAILMPISSITVVTAALRARTFRSSEP